MDLRKLPLFQMMTKRLSWLGARQEVLARNIANADTPGYKPLDVKPLEFGRAVKTEMAKLELASTSPSHLTGTIPESSFQTDKEKNPIETTLSGNAVVFEEQLMKANQTAMDYEMTTNLYRKHLAMIREALGRSG
ncbi:MAG: flagellar basal body protein [Alphaproteobacteria bacterium]